MNSQLWVVEETWLFCGIQKRKVVRDHKQISGNALDHMAIKAGLTPYYQSISQASTLTQNVTGPVGPVKPRINWSCKILTGPTSFSLTYEQNIA